MCQLVAAWDFTTTEIEKLYLQARQSFDHYPRWALSLPPLHDLRALVRARQAETSFRLGRLASARRTWAEMQRDDSFDLAIAKNLAVCDTYNSDPRQALISWSKYAELLYAHDYATGNLRRHARQRAELHRELSHAYAPRFLLDEKWQEKLDPAAIVGFLGSAGRVTNFVEHKLLEFLNARLEATSPLIILGVGRTDDKDARTQARDAWHAFHREVQSALPRGIGGPLVEFLDRRVDEAYDACSSAARITEKRDPHHNRDRQRLVELLCEFSHFKLKLLMMVQHVDDLAAGITSAAFLTQMQRLDRVPIGLSADILQTVVRKVDPTERRAKLLLETMTLVTQPIAQQLIRRVLMSVDDADEKRLRARQYRLLIDEVLTAPSMRQLLKLFDRPLNYPDFCKDILSSDAPEAVRPVLKRWHEQFPELAGVALDLGFMMHKAGENDRACEVLRSGFHRGKLVDSRIDCGKMLAGVLEQLGRADEAAEVLAQTNEIAASTDRAGEVARLAKHRALQEAFDDERYAEAAAIVLELLANDDRHWDLAQNALTIFQEAAQHDRKDPGYARLDQAVEDWLSRADRHRHAEEAKPETERAPHVKHAELEQIKQLRDTALVMIVVLIKQSPAGEMNAAALLVALDKLKDEHPRLTDAHYYRMLACQELASQAQQRHDRSTFKKHLELAAAAAKQLLKESKNEEHRAAATQLQSQAKKVLETKRK